MRDHLLSRHVNFNVHKPVITKEITTFLLYNLSGQIVGYQRYNPSFPSAYPGDGKQSNLRDRRYYNFVSSGKIGLFGIETFNLKTKCVFITEGIFDACRLTKKGACCFAMLTNTPSSSMKNFLACLGKPVIAICDNDVHGRKLKNSAHYHETVKGAKDLGECDEEFVDYLIEKYNM